MEDKAGKFDQPKLSIPPDINHYNEKSYSSKSLGWWDSARRRNNHKRSKAGTALNESSSYFKILSGTGTINENDSTSTQFQLTFLET